LFHSNEQWRSSAIENEQKVREDEMNTKSMSKTALMGTVAAAAFAGLATIAVAQTTQNPGGSGAMSPQGAQQEHKGATTGSSSTLHQQNGAQSGATGSKKSPGTSGPSAQEGNTQQKGTPTQGAQSQGNTQLKGAQEERNQHGAAQERNERGAQSEPGKAGVNATRQNALGGVKGGAASRGAAVQLTQDQRTRIGQVIGKGSSAHVSSSINFDATVGAKIPRDVHVAVLPDDVVEIVPQYRGFDYVVVGEQILIVDPASLEIVAVIET
jgi:hypothetical protein